MSFKTRARACSGLVWVLTLPGCAGAPPSPSSQPRLDPGPEPFTETFDLGSAHLWVGGHEISGPTVTCTWDGSAMNFNGVGNISFLVLPPEPAVRDAQLMSVYGKTPIVRKQLRKGTGIRKAVGKFMAVRYALWTAARERFLTEGAPAAVSYLRASPLVSLVELRGGTIITEYKGLAGGHGVGLDMLRERVPFESTLPVEFPHSYRHAVDDVLAGIKHAAARSGSRGTLIILSRSGNLRIGGGGGPHSLQADIDLIKSGASLEALGRRAQRPPLSEIIEVVRGGTGTEKP